MAHPVEPAGDESEGHPPCPQPVHDGVEVPVGFLRRTGPTPGSTRPSSARAGHEADQAIPSLKLVYITLPPYATTYGPDRDDILNVGGFSDAVFSVVAAFLAGDSGPLVAELESVEIWGWPVLGDFFLVQDSTSGRSSTSPA